MANLARRGQGPIAVIDLGSNSVLLLVLAAGERVMLERARITRLGQGVFETGRLDPDAIARTRPVVRDFARDARAAGAVRVVGVGTASLRRAADGGLFLEELTRAGILDEGRLLSGAQEARLALEASRRSQRGAAGPLAVVDVGGGSTEVAWSRDGVEVHGVSLPTGSVRLTEACVRGHPIPSEQLDALREAARDATRTLEAERSNGLRGDGTVVAVAGTATTLAAMELGLADYDPEAVEGSPISRATLAAWVTRLARLGLAERRALPGLEPGRADVIVAGLVVLEQVLERIGCPEFHVSGRGVRHGVALRLLDGAQPV